MAKECDYKIAMATQKALRNKSGKQICKEDLASGIGKWHKHSQRLTNEAAQIGDTLFSLGGKKFLGFLPETFIIIIYSWQVCGYKSIIFWSRVAT